MTKSLDTLCSVLRIRFWNFDSTCSTHAFEDAGDYHWIEAMTRLCLVFKELGLRHQAISYMRQLRHQTQVCFLICVTWRLCSVGALPNVWVPVCQDLVTDVRGSGASCHVGRMPPRDGDKGDKGAPWTR